MSKEIERGGIVGAEVEGGDGDVVEGFVVDWVGEGAAADEGGGVLFFGEGSDGLGEGEWEACRVVFGVWRERGGDVWDSVVAVDCYGFFLLLSRLKAHML